MASTEENPVWSKKLRIYFLQQENTLSNIEKLMHTLKLDKQVTTETEWQQKSYDQTEFCY